MKPPPTGTSWSPDPWARAWRAGVPSAEAAVERLFDRIRVDVEAATYTEATHYVVPTVAGFHVVTTADDGLYAVRGAEHLELKRAFARVLNDAACAVEVQHVISRDVTVAVEWPDFTIEIHMARRTEKGLAAFREREARRAMGPGDYPMLHTNWKVATHRGWWR